MEIDKQGEFSRGKWPLLGCLIGMMIGPHILPIYSQAFFLHPLEQTFGWSRLAISFGVTLLVVAITVSAPIAGYLADRISIRTLVVVSAIGEAAGFLLLSRASSSIFSYYGPMLLIAVLGGGCSTLSFSRVVTTLFRERRGTALGIAMSGVGFSNIAMPVLLAPVIANYGWRAGYLALALVVAVGAVLLAFLMRLPAATDKPAGRLPAVADGMTLGEAMATGRFWLLGILFFALSTAITGLLTQMTAMLTEAGLTASGAARAVSGIGFAILVTRWTAGILVDRFFAPYVACALYLLSAAGSLALRFGGSHYGFVGAFTAGLAIGSEIDLIGYLISRYFGQRQYGRIYGVLYVFVMTGTAISPLLFAWSYSTYGNYFVALSSSACALTLTGLAFLTLPSFPSASER